MVVNRMLAEFYIQMMDWSAQRLDMGAFTYWRSLYEGLPRG